MTETPLLPDPTPKKRRPRASIGDAAVKIVEALRRGRPGDGIRAAGVLATALERDGDSASATNIRAALTTTHGFMVSLPADKNPGDWREPTTTLDELVLEADKHSEFERMIVELEAAPRFLAAGIDAPTRIFFDGPSGTGKTLAAHHLASRLGVPMLVGRLDRLVDSHMGESAKRVADLFTTTRTVPCVVFLDEIDGMVGPRGNKASAADAEAARTTSSLLQQLDALPPAQIVIAASNFQGELDSALARRFPTKLNFDYPSLDARQKMIRYWWRNLDIGERRVWALAEANANTSGSDLRALAMAEARAFMLAGDKR